MDEPGYSDYFEEGVNVLLQIKTAELEDYDDAPSRVTYLTIYPENVKYLSVMMNADPDVIDDKDVIGYSGLSRITVLVNDDEGNPVPDVTLDMLVDPAEPTVSGTEITDANGKASYTFTAADIDKNREYQISVLASKSGYKNDIK